jgi:arylsulfatase A-like enzyme
MPKELSSNLPLTENSEKLRPGLLLVSLVSIFCLSLEIELLEQLDSLSLYMTFREILMDTGVALLMVLGMTVAWWLCIWLLAWIGGLADRTGACAKSVFWYVGFLVPLSFLVFELFGVVLLGTHRQPGVWGYLILGVIYLGLCILGIRRISVPALQQFCSSRLSSLGWLHIVLGGVVVVALWMQGAYWFRDYVHPGKTATASQLPDIYLITIDALRADGMSVYGYDRPTTPNLERFAKRAFVFDAFFSNSNFTTSSTTSIETGKLPWSHGVFHLGGFLRGDAQRENLAELLHARGYYTATVSSNHLASPILHRTLTSYDAAVFTRPGNTTGAWMHYTTVIGLDTLYTLSSSLFNHLVSFRYYVDALIWKDRYWSPAEPVFESARHIAERPDISQPRFVWMHILPPHDPYVAPPPFQKAFLSSGKLTHNSDYIRYRHEAPPPGVSVDELRARYDENIAYADHAVGDFLDWLDQTGRLDRSIILVSADHGESFEHHWLKHSGPYLYNGLIHIPLLVHVPGQTQGGRIAQPAEQADLLPTVLDLVGVQVPAWTDGTSLRPAIEGRPLPQRYLFSMNLQPNSAFKPLSKGTVAVMDDEFKYVNRLDTHQESLYRYKADPREENDLMASQPDVAKRMSQVLASKLREVDALRATRR